MRVPLRPCVSGVCNRGRVFISLTLCHWGDASSSIDTFIQSEPMLFHAFLFSLIADLAPESRRKKTSTRLHQTLTLKCVIFEY